MELTKYYDILSEIGINANKIYYGLFERLNRLNTMRYEVKGKLLDHLCTKDNKVEEVIIKAIYFNAKFVGNFEIPLSWCLNLELSNGQTKPVMKLNLRDHYHLIDIMREMDELLEKPSEEKHKVKKIHVENKDIIITDPCYIIKHVEQPENEHKKAYYDFITKDKSDYFLITKNGWVPKEMTINQLFDAYNKEKEYYRIKNSLEKKWRETEVVDDWELVDNGENMEAIGLTNYLTSSTIYGDWSCTTFNTDTKEPIGEFCADAGMVGVFELDEVLKYNPEYNGHIEKPWTTTLIKGFTGDIWIEIEHTEGVYEDTTEYHKKGDRWENDSVHVVGKGNINFRTSQTGF